MVLVVMGVSGSGKTTIGELLAGRLRARFTDADSFHSEANRAKMAAGVPLDDADRGPWLAALNELLLGWTHDGCGGVLACSALKASHRELLVRGVPGAEVAFVLLEVSRATLAKRLAARRGHFMGPALLDSQLATLEDPGQGALRVENEGVPEETVDRILALVAGVGGATDKEALA